MALPLVNSAVDCADFSSTVSPYLHQLPALPKALFETAASPSATAIYQLFVDTNPLISAFFFSLALALVFLLTSQVNNNYSQVDRCWSILPAVYVLHFALYAHATGLESTRLDLLLVITLLWGIRLTFNYARKGGYKIGSEDYRWAIVRQHISPPLFFVVNVLFISLSQSVLLFLFTSPAYVLLVAARLSTPFDASHLLSIFSPTSTVPTVKIQTLPALDALDLIIAFLLVLCILGALVADNQQWSFQSAKHAYLSTAKLPKGSTYSAAQLDLGFNTAGLWRYSRHPNFLFEQSFWILLYFWTVLRTGKNSWAGVGALAYLALFQASTWLTELISARKYEGYRIYQERVGMFLPRLSGGGWDESAMRQAQHRPSLKKKKSATESILIEREEGEDKVKAKERYHLR